MILKSFLRQSPRYILILFFIHIITVSGLADDRPPKNGVHKTLHPNGKVKTEETYKNGEREGIAKIYDEAGRLVRKIKFKNGEIVSSYAYEPKKDWGIFKFVVSPKFWVFTGIGLLLVLFLTFKFLFTNRPF